MTRIICLGDSLTYGYGIPRSQVGTALLAARTGMECVNRGVNGTTTGGMLAVMTGELEKLHYDAVILMGGSNDLAYGRDLTGARANMGAMAHIAMSARVCPFIGVPCAVRLVGLGRHAGGQNAQGGIQLLAERALRDVPAPRD